MFLFSDRYESAFRVINDACPVLVSGVNKSTVVIVVSGAENVHRSDDFHAMFMSDFDEFSEVVVVGVQFRKFGGDVAIVKHFTGNRSNTNDCVSEADVVNFLDVVFDRVGRGETAEISLRVNPHKSGFLFFRN